MKHILKRIDIKLKLLLLFFFISLYIISNTYPEKSKRFPQLISLSTTIIIIFSLILDFSKKEKIENEITDVGDTELKKIDESLKNVRRNRFYKAWGIILLSTAIGFWGGFLLSTFLLLIGFPIIFGEKNKLPKNITIAIILTLIVFFIFHWIFGISLLKGI